MIYKHALGRKETGEDLLMTHPSELLEDLARRTWHRIKDGHRLHIRQGETAISDDILLEIARAHFPSIKIIKTPLTKEASQGTDWEWWVGSRRRGWIRYAMQAKRLVFPRDRYDALGHKVDSCPQVDILIDYAERNLAVPLYCLYNVPTILTRKSTGTATSLLNWSSSDVHWRLPEQLR